MICIVAVLAGCQKSYYYNYDELSNKIEKVEIISVDYIDGKKEITVIKILTEEEADELLINLSKIEFKTPMHLGGSLPTLRGLCLKLFNKDNTYELISNYMTESYDNENERTSWSDKGCSEEALSNLISKYIDKI